MDKTESLAEDTQDSWLPTRTRDELFQHQREDYDISDFTQNCKLPSLDGLVEHFKRALMNMLTLQLTKAMTGNW